MTAVTATSSVTSPLQAAAQRPGVGDVAGPGTRVDATAGGTATNSSVTPPTENAALSAAAQAALSPQQIAASIIGDAAARQNGLAPLYADLAALVKSGQPVPAPVSAMVRQLLALPLDLASKSTVSAAEIKDALMQSGLVAASPAAVANAGSAAAAMVAPQAQIAGLNLVLGLMRRTLLNWRDEEQIDTVQAGTTTLAANGARVTATDPRQAPPPPFRNGPTVPQAAVEAALPDDIAGLALAQHLLDRTEAAIARQTLMQVASLSDGDATAAKPGPDGRHLIFDIPMATPQGTAVAQFRIERDGAGSEVEASKPTWRASFAIDVEPIGRVHAHIALVGDRTSVTLRAERPESAALFNDHMSQLESALRDADLEPGTLACTNNAAATSQPAAAPGMFLDSKT